MTLETAALLTTSALCTEVSALDVRNGGRVGSSNVTNGSIGIGCRRPANALSQLVPSLLAALTCSLTCELKGWSPKTTMDWIAKLRLTQVSVAIAYDTSLA